MWNLTPDYLANTKEELKGRRAAIQARIADEIKAIEVDLEEIEALERAAYAFAVKHLPDGIPETPVTSEPEAERETLFALQSGSIVEHGEDAAPEPTDSDGSSSSRWRMRLNARDKAESAS